jgi:hypothetical protein
MLNYFLLSLVSVHLRKMMAFKIPPVKKANYVLNSWRF